MEKYFFQAWSAKKVSVLIWTSALMAITTVILTKSARTSKTETDGNAARLTLNVQLKYQPQNGKG